VAAALRTASHSNIINSLTDIIKINKPNFHYVIEVSDYNIPSQHQHNKTIVTMVINLTGESSAIITYNPNNEKCWAGP
jgi:hypothetical protein